MAALAAQVVCALCMGRQECQAAATAIYSSRGAVMRDSIAANRPAHQTKDILPPPGIITLIQCVNYTLVQVCQHHCSARATMT